VADGEATPWSLPQPAASVAAESSAAVPIAVVRAFATRIYISASPEIPRIRPRYAPERREGRMRPLL